MEELKTIKSFNSNVILSDKIILVDFYAVWCKPCSKLIEYLESEILPMSKELNFKLYKTKGYTDKQKDQNKTPLGELYIKGKVPFIVVFKKKKVIKTFEGNTDVRANLLKYLQGVKNDY